MDTFEKVMLRGNKNQRTCIIAGSGLGYIDQLIASMNTVFLLDCASRRYRAKNVIYRSSFEGIDTVPDVDLVLLDHDQYRNLKWLRPILLEYKPPVFIQGQALWPIEHYKYFRSFGYGLVEFYTNMQKWILI
jgi:hypothetical protein